MVLGELKTEEVEREMLKTEIRCISLIYMEVWMNGKEDNFQKDRQHREKSAQKNSYRV